MKLLERVTFLAGHRTKEVVRTMEEVAREGVGPGDSDVWERAALLVPPLPPTNLGGHCGIIKVTIY